MTNTHPAHTIITLETFRQVSETLAEEIVKAFPDFYFGHAGLLPNNNDRFGYECTPLNTTIFAHTGGDGVHYSLLELSETIQPVVMTVPMNFGDDATAYNLILGENLYEFLSLGFYNGWFHLENLCYQKEWIIEYYSGEDTSEWREENGDTHFIKKMREHLNYQHIPLRWERIKALENQYFHHLQFNPEFLEEFEKRKLFRP